MTVDQPDRRALECAGWRTLLDYRENHVRDDEGTLVAVVPRWTAEAEREHDSRTVVASATASSIDEVWARLRQATVYAGRRPYDGAADFV
ncbi:MAG: hypothetical protein JWM34_4989 [Ilumatobacteraceae bacterium]|nr:hypothetical protein [Ilumatobacteraceae bacterium]